MKYLYKIIYYFLIEVLICIISFSFSEDELLVNIVGYTEPLQEGIFARLNFLLLGIIVADALVAQKQKEK